VLNTVGRSKEAWAFADEARETFARHGNRLGAAQAVRRLAQIARFQGRLNDAERLASKALVTFERLGDRRGEAMCLSELGELYRAGWSFDKAEESYRTARAIYKEIGSRQTLTTDLNLTLILLQQERWHAVDRAVIYLENNLSESARGPQLLVSLCRLVLYARRGSWPGFDAAMGDAEQLNPRGKMTDPDFAWPAELAGRFAAAEGRPERARTAYDMALRQYVALGDTDAQVRLLAAIDELPPDPLRR
jgi:tetratricopeptide (TPR) repeat protein